MADVTDRRQQRTRAALQGAFRELMFDRGYEALTIGAVTAAANIGRSTFYEHYRTKEDLLRASVHAPFLTLADLVLPVPPEDALVGLLQHFRQNQQLARVLLGWPTRPVLAAALADLVEARLAAMPQLRPLIPAAIVARQIADMQLALIESWIAGRPAMALPAATSALARATGALVTALCQPPGLHS